MTNVGNLNTDRMMEQFSKVVPFLLMIFALLSFIAVGIFSVDYYSELLESRFKASSYPMAILIAGIQELVRLGLLIASVRDFSDTKPLNGWLGLIASVALVWHDVKVAEKISLMWNQSEPGQYFSLFVFLILVGLVLEIRLILTVPGAASSKESITPKKETAKNLVNGIA
ncbi:MAG TPA: hypothetical protein DDX98_06505 [Bacteroidales bacterium]|nr:hypothetical protein [Bacteroidales bacterium]